MIQLGSGPIGTVLIFILVEKPVNLIHHTSTLIINKRIQNLAGTTHRPNIIVRNSRRNQATETLLDHDLITRSAHLDHAIALKAHRNDKTVVFKQVPMELMIHLRHAGTKEFGLHNQVRAVIPNGIIGPIFPLHLVVKCLSRICSMEFARLAVQSRPVIIENPVSNVR